MACENGRCEEIKLPLGSSCTIRCGCTGHARREAGQMLEAFFTSKPLEHVIPLYSSIILSKLRIIRNCQKHTDGTMVSFPGGIHKISEEESKNLLRDESKKSGQLQFQIKELGTFCLAKHQPTVLSKNEVV